MISKLFGFLVLVHLISFVTCEQCTQNEFDKADEDFLRITLLGHPKVYFPSDAPTLIKQCKGLKQDYLELKTFSNKCLSALSKQTVGFLLRGVNREIKRYCSESERQAFLSASQCATTIIKENRACYNQFVKELKQIMNAPQDDKFELVCCSNYNFQDCVKKSLSTASDCSSQSTNIYMRMVKGYTDDVRALICTNTEYGSPKCISGNQKINKLPVNEIKTKSPILPFLEITKSLASN